MSITRMSSWVPYRGVNEPRKGEQIGWRHLVTDEVRYQDEKPGDEDLKPKLTRFDFEEGQIVKYKGFKVKYLGSGEDGSAKIEELQSFDENPPMSYDVPARLLIPDGMILVGEDGYRTALEKAEKLNSYRVKKGLGGTPYQVEIVANDYLTQYEVLKKDGSSFWMVDNPKDMAGLTPSGRIRVKKVIRLSGEAPKYDGWGFAAKLTPLAGDNGTAGNLVMSYPDAPAIPAKYRSVVGECEHCGVKRQRSETFVMFNSDTGEFRCVGRQCMKDFLGHSGIEDAIRQIEMIAEWGEIKEEDEGGGGGGGWRRDVYDLSNWLDVSAASIRAEGWKPAAFAGSSTRSHVAYLLTPPRTSREFKDWKADVERYKPTDEDREFAAKAIEWAKTLSESENDYLYNLGITAAAGKVVGKNAGLATSILAAYAKANDIDLGTRESKKKLEEEKPVELSEHFGAVGERAVYDFTVRKVRSYEARDFVTGRPVEKQVYTFADPDGRMAVWFTDGEPFDVGQKVRVKATVKEHSEFRGMKQTVVNRVEEYEEPIKISAKEIEKGGADEARKVSHSFRYGKNYLAEAEASDGDKTYVNIISEGKVVDSIEAANDPKKISSAFKKWLEKNRAQKMSAWVKYKGPRDGEGWRSTATGEVRYQEDQPDAESSGKPKQFWEMTEAEYKEVTGYPKGKTFVPGVGFTREYSAWSKVNGTYDQILLKAKLRGEVIDESLVGSLPAGFMSRVFPELDGSAPWQLTEKEFDEQYLIHATNVDSLDSITYVEPRIGEMTETMYGDDGVDLKELAFFAKPSDLSRVEHYATGVSVVPKSGKPIILITRYPSDAAVVGEDSQLFDLDGNVVGEAPHGTEPNDIISEEGAQVVYAIPLEDLKGKTVHQYFVDKYADGKKETAIGRWAKARFKDAEKAERFADWFEGSKVVDEDGEPLVMYHGTKQEFDDPEMLDPQQGEIGTHFTDSPDVANEFTERIDVKGKRAVDSNGRVYPVYLSIKNPLHVEIDPGIFWSDTIMRALVGDEGVEEFRGRKLSDKEATKQCIKLLQEHGYDGVSYYNRYEGDAIGDSAFVPGTVTKKWYVPESEFLKAYPDASLCYIAIKPEQVKSAVSSQFKKDSLYITMGAKRAKWKPYFNVEEKKTGRISEGGLVRYSPLELAPLLKPEELDAKEEPIDLAERVPVKTKQKLEVAEKSPVLQWARETFGDKVAPNGKTVAENFASWFGKSKAVNSDGEPEETVPFEPIEVYHGTTHNFEEFDLDKTNPDSHMGRGFYFSSEVGDSSENYGGYGPDLISRIETLQDRLEESVSEALDEIREDNSVLDGDISAKGIAKAIAERFSVDPERLEEVFVDGGYNERDVAYAVAEAKLKGGEERVVKAYLKIEKPFVMGSPALDVMPWEKKQIRSAPEKGETFLTVEMDEVDSEGRTPDDDDFDSDTAEVTELKGSLVDFVEALKRIGSEVSDYVPNHFEEQLDLLVSENVGEGIPAGLLPMKLAPALMDMTDNNGELIGADVIRQALQEIGFDGVIYLDASSHFPGFGRGRTGTAIPPGTRHYIVWDSSQIKSSDENGGNFDPSAKNIRMGVEQDVAKACKITDRNPTDAQKKAGNYTKGKVRIHGFEVAIENPKGSDRSGVSDEGEKWTQKMHAHYGYILRSESKDGDHVDVFVGPNPSSEFVVVIDQLNGRGGFDEHKVMLGYSTESEAVDAYLKHYPRGWKVGPVSSVSIGQFKQWLERSDTKKKFSESAIKAVI